MTCIHQFRVTILRGISEIYMSSEATCKCPKLLNYMFHYLLYVLSK